jgi:hypothetical protein
MEIVERVPVGGENGVAFGHVGSSRGLKQAADPHASLLPA